jgi:hypothetical protein
MPNLASAELLDSAAYLRAFEAMAEGTFVQVFSVDPATKGLQGEQIRQKAREAANAFGECHMAAMSAYSEELQNVAYEEVATGGSYADAETAFEAALSKELDAGGASAEAVKKMMSKSIALGAPCAERVKNAL